MKNQFLLSIDLPSSIEPLLIEVATFPDALRTLQAFPGAEVGTSADFCGGGAEMLASFCFLDGIWLVRGVDLYESEYLGGNYVEKDCDAPHVEILREDRWTISAVLADLNSWNQGPGSNVLRFCN